MITDLTVELDSCDSTDLAFNLRGARRPTTWSRTRRSTRGRRAGPIGWATWGTSPTRGSSEPGALRGIVGETLDAVFAKHGDPNRICTGRRFGPDPFTCFDLDLELAVRRSMDVALLELGIARRPSVVFANQDEPNSDLPGPRPVGPGPMGRPVRRRRWSGPRHARGRRRRSRRERPRRPRLRQLRTAESRLPGRRLGRVRLLGPGRTRIAQPEPRRRPHRPRPRPAPRRGLRERRRVPGPG